MNTSMSWTENEELTVTHEGQTITASGEEWLYLAVSALTFLPGKRNSDGTSFLLAPYGTDPDMIGQLIATMLKNQPPYNNG